MIKTKKMEALEKFEILVEENKTLFEAVSGCDWLGKISRQKMQQKWVGERMEKLLENILATQYKGLSYQEAKKWDYDTLTPKDAKELIRIGKIVKVRHPITGHVFYIGTEYVAGFFESLASEVISNTNAKK